MKLRRWIPCLGALLVSGSVCAGDLVIGHVSVRLGMSQTEALSALAKEFDVKQVSVTEGKYLLWTREAETKTAYSAGTVSFRNGKLYRASKTWATAGVKNKNDAAGGLFAALSAAGCQSGKTCKVKAETLRTPAGSPNGEDVDLVTIQAPPDRSVFVTVWRPQAGCDPVLNCEWKVEEYLMEGPASP